MPSLNQKEVICEGWVPKQQRRTVHDIRKDVKLGPYTALNHSISQRAPGTNTRNFFNSLEILLNCFFLSQQLSND